MPTTNPVPSTDPSDLLFNAGKLDEVVNGTASSFTDRLGAQRRTLAGLSAEFPNAAANAAAAAASAVDAADYARAAQDEVAVATEQAGAADASRVAAEAARDAAQLSAGVYATTAAGLAATTSGEYFNVPANSANDSLILYQNSGGTAVEVKRYPSTAVVDSLAETTSSNNGTRALVAWTDSAGEVVMSLSADGKLRVAGNAGPLTDAHQIVENANTVLVGFASADDEVVAGFDSDGDLLIRGHGNVMNRIASNDFITGMEYEAWGDVSKKLFYFDKAKSALSKRININRIVVGWNEDADTDYVRFPYALPLSDTTGLLFFGQRRAPQGTGENGNRLCVRDYTINYASSTITTSATRVIDQPSGYVNRTGFAGGAAAIKLPNGNIVMTYFRLLPDTMVWSDPSYENHIYRTISTDNGATWSTPTSVMGPHQTYNALTGGTGGVPGSLPSRLGPNSGTGNWLIRIPSGPYAGRLVFSMYFENNYFGCAYSDDNGATWTRGTLTNAAGGNVYNETAIEFCSSDGGIVALRRCENILGVGRYVSTDGGATFSYTGHVSSAGFSNSSISLISASRSAATGFEKLIAANTADPVNYRRQFHQLRLSYDKGAAFVGKATLFPDGMNVGYGSLARMGNGYYLLAYETFNGTSAINTQNNIGVYVFNEAELFFRAAPV